MTISRRIYLGFFSVTALAGLIFLVGLAGFNAVNDRIEHLVGQIEPLRKQIVTINTSLTNVTRTLLMHPQEQDSQRLDSLEEQFRSSLDQVINSIENINRQSETLQALDYSPADIRTRTEQLQSGASALFSAHRQSLKLKSDLKTAGRHNGDMIDILSAGLNSSKTLETDTKVELKRLLEYTTNLTSTALGKSSSLELSAETRKLDDLLDQLKLRLQGDTRLEKNLENLRASCTGEHGVLTITRAQIDHQKTLEAALTGAAKDVQSIAESIASLTTKVSSLAENDMTNTLSETRKKRMLLIVFALCILIVSSTLSVLVIRSILPPLYDVITRAHRVAKGDLTVTFDTHRHDELGELALGLQQLIAELNKVMRQIIGGADQLAAAAEEFTAMSEQSTSYAQQQMEETQNFAAAIVEMSASIEHIAKSSGDTLGAVKHTRSTVQEGQAKMATHVDNIGTLARSIEQAGNNIDQLSEVSARIGSILDAIRAIADQTNLLALNAAIEAARAGEQGRGFAVVADEVRTLASRTGASTTEIQGMIEKLQANMRNAVQEMQLSRQSAQAGMNEVVQASESLTHIGMSVESIREMNIQIASATDQQNAVAAELARNVSHISELAENNARASKENLTVSRNLATLADAQRQLTHRFQLN